MSSFDPSLDKELFYECADVGSNRYSVAIKQYNNGVPKLHISKQTSTTIDGSYKYVKLGRLTKEEMEALMPLFQKALNCM